MLSLTVILSALLLSSCREFFGADPKNELLNDFEKEEMYPNHNYEQFTTKEGVDCVALGHPGMAGRGLSCNWEKYNREHKD